MLSHISFGVLDLARSVRFYDAVLEPLGIVRLWRSDAAAGYGYPNPAANEQLALFQRSVTGAALAAGPGFHLAFTAPSRDAVERFHVAALAAGGTDEGAAGPRPRYGATYYAAFVRDPDGHKLEAVHQVAPADAGG